MSNRTPIYMLAAVLLLLIVGGWIVYMSGSDWTERGTIGDSFGAVNSLFSGLAFAGVVYAILLQRQELSLQREELRLTRDELKKGAEAQADTAGTQKLLAQLNAYTALLTFKIAELERQRVRMQSKSAGIQRQAVDQHKKLYQEATKIEALIENVLFSVGGHLGEGIPQDLCEAKARIDSTMSNLDKLTN